MKTKLNPRLCIKLQELTAKYEKVTEFAELLPLFSEEIIAREYTGESYCKLADRVGKLYCPWGINWSTHTPTNYPEEKHSQEGFVSLYINNISLFGDACYPFACVELGKALPEIEVHFYDELNTTFYFLPHEAENGLKRIEQWFIETKGKCEEYIKQKRKEELQRELEKLS